jgi:uncharacterized membrane protein YfcA
MAMTLGFFFIIMALAFVCEFFDSSLGMGYGTILSPILVVLGFDPLFIVPALLISQAMGGFTASMFHARLRNASFSRNSKDLRNFLIITICGCAATIFGAIVAVSIPQIVLTTYIGALVLAMGIIVVINMRFRFSYWTVFGVGILSAFNKSLSGGGYGPIVTSGQIIGGHTPKRSVGVTTLAEAPICIVGFLTYIVTKLIKQGKGAFFARPVDDIVKSIFSPSLLRWDLIVALIIGAMLIAPFGPRLTKAIHREKWHYVLGPIMIILGALVLIKNLLVLLHVEGLPKISI